MTTPQIIDGGKSPPSPHHPAVRSETMTERRRCLAIIDQRIETAMSVADLPSIPTAAKVAAALLNVRTRIESGEQS